MFVVSSFCDVLRRDVCCVVFLVWCGVVWCGVCVVGVVCCVVFLVWCDVVCATLCCFVWCGAVWCGVVWYCLCSPLCSFVLRYGV